MSRTGYVVYRGDEPIGTYLDLPSLAKALGVSYDTASCMATPSYRKKRGNSEKALIVVRVERDE